jgi:hypothetical protein
LYRLTPNPFVGVGHSEVKNELSRTSPTPYSFTWREQSKFNLTLKLQMLSISLKTYYIADEKKIIFVTCIQACVLEQLTVLNVRPE